MASERWLTLHQADYSTSSRIRWLKVFSIGAAAIFPGLSLPRSFGLLCNSHLISPSRGSPEHRRDRRSLADAEFGLKAIVPTIATMNKAPGIV